MPSREIANKFLSREITQKKKKEKLRAANALPASTEKQSGNAVR